MKFHPTSRDSINQIEGFPNNSLLYFPANGSWSETTNELFTKYSNVSEDEVCETNSTADATPTNKSVFKLNVKRIKDKSVLSDEV